MISGPAMAVRIVLFFFLLLQWAPHRLSPPKFGMGPAKLPLRKPPPKKKFGLAAGFLFFPVVEHCKACRFRQQNQCSSKRDWRCNKHKMVSWIKMTCHKTGDSVKISDIHLYVRVDWTGVHADKRSRRKAILLSGLYVPLQLNFSLLVLQVFPPTPCFKNSKVKPTDSEKLADNVLIPSETKPTSWCPVMEGIFNLLIGTFACIKCELIYNVVITQMITFKTLKR